EAPDALRRSARHLRRRLCIGRAADVAVHRAAAADSASARLRARRHRASAPARTTLRRRAHGLVPVLLAARRGRGAPARSLPALRRLARGLDEGVLARLPGTARRRRRMAGSAPVRAGPPASVLLLAAAR